METLAGRPSPRGRAGIAAAFARNNVQVEYQSLRPGTFMTILNWLLPVGSVLLFVFIGWRVYASMGGPGDFQQAEANTNAGATFADVAGVDEARAELAER